MNDSDKKNEAGTLLVLTLCYFVSFLLIFVDWFTKYVVSHNMSLGGQVNVINGFLSLYYVRNTGSAFSFLADTNWGIYFFSVVSFIMGIALIWAVKRSLRCNYMLFTVSLVLLIAGAFGNLIDRVRFHYVIDFIRFDFGTYTFPIFNVADICAVFGTIFLIIVLIFKSSKIVNFFDKKQA